MITEAIRKIKQTVDLSQREMEEVFTEIMSGRVETDEIATFLLALKEKKETVDEITGAAEVMRRFVTRINAEKDYLLDTCGTGGDGSDTFNISTISAFLASAAGCKIAKHGNRAVSSRCGSADLLEALGVKIDVENDVVEKCIAEIGIGFLFAPRLHLAMKYAMPARKMIKTRSIFNILGPLTNPAGAPHQLLGVYDKNLVKPLANVLKNLGSISAMVVHGKDGLDEITTTGATMIAELKNGKIKTYVIAPKDYGFRRADKKDLKGQDTSFNAKVALDILNGEKGPKRDIVVLNAAAAIYVSKVARTMEEGVEKAMSALDLGLALKKLKGLQRLTNS